MVDKVHAGDKPFTLAVAIKGAGATLKLKAVKVEKKTTTKK
jgi:hypothetical protein